MVLKYMPGHDKVLLIHEKAIKIHESAKIFSRAYFIKFTFNSEITQS
jgi:hypothetical protein